MDIPQDCLDTLYNNGYEYITAIEDNGYSTVHQIAKDGQNYILKLFSGSRTSNFHQDILRNIEAYHNCSSSVLNMVQYQTHFLNGEDIYLVTEYCDYNTLESYLADNSNMTEEIALLLIKNVSKVISELYYMGIIHCNITPKNIFIIDYNSCDIKISEFCLLQNEDYTFLPSYIDGILLPQEYVYGSKPYSINYDMYLIGILAIQLCIGSIDNYTQPDIDKILQQINSKFSQSYCDLISECIAGEDNRIDMANFNLLIDKLNGYDNYNYTDETQQNILDGYTTGIDGFDVQDYSRLNEEGHENEEGAEQQFIDEDEIDDADDDLSVSQFNSPEEFLAHLNSRIEKVDDDIYNIKCDNDTLLEQKDLLKKQLSESQTKKANLKLESKDLSDKLSKIKSNTLNLNLSNNINNMNSDSDGNFDFSDKQKQILDLKIENNNIRKQFEDILHIYQNECYKQDIKLHPFDEDVRKTLLGIDPNMINDNNDKIHPNYGQQPEFIYMRDSINSIFKTEKCLSMHPRFSAIFSAFLSCCDPGNHNNVTLDLSNIPFQRYSEGFYVCISKAIISLPHIIHINLNNCLLGDQGIITLSECFQHLDHLESLLADGNEIGDDGYFCLIDNLKFNKNLKILSLDNNWITNIMMVKSKIENNLSSLNTLNLKGNRCEVQESSLVLSTLDRRQCTIHLA